MNYVRYEEYYTQGEKFTHFYYYVKGDDVTPLLLILDLYKKRYPGLKYDFGWIQASQCWFLEIEKPLNWSEVATR